MDEHLRRLQDQLNDLCQQLDDALREDEADDAERLIKRLLTHPWASSVEWATTYDELAMAYNNQGHYPKAINAMNRALAAGRKGNPDGRADIAAWLLDMGHHLEANSLFAVVQRETPEDVWLYNNAGLANAKHGDHRMAAAWLSLGLELALRTGDPEQLVAQLSEERRVSLHELSCVTSDALTQRAEAFLAGQPPAPDPAP